MKMGRIFTLFLSFGMLIFMADGCSKDDSPTSPSSNTAKVMAVHASPDAPAVDVLLDGVVAAGDLAFTEHTPYLPVPAGTHSVKINVAGTSQTVLELPAVPVTAGLVISVFAIGYAENLGVLPLVDDLTSPSAGKSKIRFLNLSPNAPAGDLTDTDGNILFGDVSFGDDLSDFDEVDAGTYNIQLRLAGTSEVLLEVQNITLTAGKIYTVFLEGIVGGEGAQALGATVIINK